MADVLLWLHASEQSTKKHKGLSASADPSAAAPAAEDDEDVDEATFSALEALLDEPALLQLRARGRAHFRRAVIEARRLVEGEAADVKRRGDIADEREKDVEDYAIEEDFIRDSLNFGDDNASENSSDSDSEEAMKRRFARLLPIWTARKAAALRRCDEEELSLHRRARERADREMTIAKSDPLAYSALKASRRLLTHVRKAETTLQALSTPLIPGIPRAGCWTRTKALIGGVTSLWWSRMVYTHPLTSPFTRFDPRLSRCARLALVGGSMMVDLFLVTYWYQFAFGGNAVSLGPLSGAAMIVVALLAATMQHVVIYRALTSLFSWAGDVEWAWRYPSLTSELGRRRALESVLNAADLATLKREMRQLGGSPLLALGPTPAGLLPLLPPSTAGGSGAFSRDSATSYGDPTASRGGSNSRRASGGPVLAPALAALPEDVRTLLTSQPHKADVDARAAEFGWTDPPDTLVLFCPLLVRCCGRHPNQKADFVTRSELRDAALSAAKARAIRRIKEDRFAGLVAAATSSGRDPPPGVTAEHMVIMELHPHEQAIWEECVGEAVHAGRATRGCILRAFAAIGRGIRAVFRAFNSFISLLLGLRHARLPGESSAASGHIASGTGPSALLDASQALKSQRRAKIAARLQRTTFSLEGLVTRIQRGLRAFGHYATFGYVHLPPPLTHVHEDAVFVTTGRPTDVTLPLSSAPGSLSFFFTAMTSHAFQYPAQTASPSIVVGPRASVEEEEPFTLTAGARLGLWRLLPWAHPITGASLLAWSVLGLLTSWAAYYSLVWGLYQKPAVVQSCLNTWGIALALRLLLFVPAHAFVSLFFASVVWPSVLPFLAWIPRGVGKRIVASTLDEEDTLHCGGALAGRLQRLTIPTAAAYASGTGPETGVVAFSSTATLIRGLYRSPLVAARATTASVNDALRARRAGSRGRRGSWASAETATTADVMTALALSARAGGNNRAGRGGVTSGYAAAHHLNARLTAPARVELIVKRYLVHQLLEGRASRAGRLHTSAVLQLTGGTDGSLVPVLASPSPFAAAAADVTNGDSPLALKGKKRGKNKSGAAKWEASPLPSALGLGLNYSSHPGVQFLTKQAVATDMLEEDPAVDDVITAAAAAAAKKGQGKDSTSSVLAKLRGARQQQQQQQQPGR